MRKDLLGKTLVMGVVILFIGSGFVLNTVRKVNAENNPSTNSIAVFDTTMGTFEVELFADKVPITTGNFIDLANDGYYDGVIFHRVIAGFMIQGGDPTGTGRGGHAAEYHEGYGDPDDPDTWVIPDEFYDDLKHNTAGVLSMANSGPNTGGSQFFITVASTPWLDGKHAVFGRVSTGMDVVYDISEVDTNDNDRPIVDVVINSITIEQPPDSPTLISPGTSSAPGETIDTLTPTFQWNSVPDANYYSLYISKYPYGSENLVYDSNKEYGSIYGTSFTLPDGILKEGEKYRWNMQAYNDAGWSEYSEKLYFTTSGGEIQSNILAAFDINLLNLIDQYAETYYNSKWKLNIEQYKAWILTIAWGEGGKGGYTAHSRAALGSDKFYHRAVDVKDKFNFSTGLGPFQLDNGGYDTWQFWKTLDKLDPEKSVKSIFNDHYKRYGDGKTLWDFSNNSRWFSVNPNYNGKADILWDEVTDTNWNNHKKEKVSLDWINIKNQLSKNAKSSIYKYDENIISIGKVKWNISKNDDIKTDSNKIVIFEDYIDTWKITARNEYGNKMFNYYYTFNSNQEVEVWVWDNSGDSDNKYRYIYTREYSTGQYPENRTSDRTSAGYILSHPALDLDKNINGEGTDDKKNEDTPGFEIIFVILALALFIFWKRKKGN